jgi:hypothetical protein
VAESGVARRAKRNRELLALLRAGTTSFQAVGADYGLSGERVRQIARKLGYAGRQRSPLWRPDADRRLRRLVRTGLSASLIADRLGVTKNAVTGRAFRLGLLLLGKKRRPTKMAVTVPPRRCATCGRVFTPKRSYALHCSRLCRAAAYRQRRRASRH